MTLRDRLSALHGADADALRAFWADAPDAGRPVVEPGSTADVVRVTALWRSTDARAVHVGIARVTDRSAWRDGLMTRVPGTDVWWLERELPADLRSTTSFRVFRDEQPAAHHFTGRPWERTGPEPECPRELALPAAPLAGVLDGPHRPVAVTRHATPWGASWTTSPHGARTLLVLTDGRTWVERLDLPAVLAAVVPYPVAIAALDSGSREERLATLGGDTGHAEFLADTFLPWARRTTGVDADRTDTWFAGQSLGGLTALLVASRRPAAFGTVVAQSPSVWWDPSGTRTPTDMPPPGARPWIADQLGGPGDAPPTRVLLHGGTLEGTTAHHVVGLAARLRALGHDAVATPFTGGHEASCWRAALLTELIDAVPSLTAGRSAD